MIKKSKKKNNLKEYKIMENNIVEELNHNIEKVNEVTEENINEIKKSIKETEEITEEITNEVNETVEQVEETINEVEESTNKIEEIKEEVTEEVTEPDIIVPIVENNEVIGKIIEFEKLYVRKEASKYSEPVGIVTDKDYLSIDIIHSTDDFYKVITSNGLEGYCVKEFVKID